jgi:hypothetical protein
MLKLIFALLGFVGFMIFSNIVVAIAPQDVIEAKNLEANFILIGKVVATHQSATPPYFDMQIVNTIKGIKELKPNEQIKILMSSPPPEPVKGIAAHSQGILPVKVEVGSLIVVYINRSESHPDYFEPLLEGLSVVKIGQPL